MLNNVIFVQAERPSDVPIDTIPNMTSNNAPYGTVTCNPVDGFYDTSKLYYMFKQGTKAGTNAPACKSGVDGQIIYTYDENYRPSAGTYQVKYTSESTYSASEYMSKYTIDIYTTDDNYTRITRNNRDSFTQNVTVSLPITKIVITNKRTSGSGSEMCPVQLLKPAITTEGTLWVNNGVEPLEIMARDNNAQWQPFNDVLLGTCTVDSSHNITAVTNVGFNYFSTVNMHNISTVSHEDIRADIDTLTTNKQDRINSDNKLSSELLSGTIPNTLIGSEIARTSVKKILSVSNGTIPLSREYAYYMSIPDADTTYTFDTTDFNLAQDEAIDFYLTIVMPANVFNLTFPSNIVWQNNQPVDFTSTGIYTLEIIIINGIPYVFNSGKY